MYFIICNISISACLRYSAGSCWFPHVVLSLVAMNRFLSVAFCLLVSLRKSKIKGELESQAGKDTGGRRPGRKSHAD